MAPEPWRTNFEHKMCGAGGQPGLCSPAACEVTEGPTYRGDDLYDMTASRFVAGMYIHIRSIKFELTGTLRIFTCLECGSCLLNEEKS